MSTTKPDKHDAIPAIVDKFDVYTEPNHWEIHCPHCDTVWALERKEQTHPGNILFLLNHAAGHKVQS